MMRQTQNAVALVGLLSAAAAVLSGCVSSCPAIQYLDTSPIVLEFTKPLHPTAVVSACFGDSCRPAEVPAGRDGKWEVPQEEPYLDESSLSNGQPLHVVIAYGTSVIHDVYRIPTAPDEPESVGRCGGPWHYEPVVIDFPDGQN